MLHTRITRYTVLICGLALFALGGVLAYQDKTASAVTVFAYAGLCLLFVFLQGFKWFKGFGLEAELLEQKIEEADRLLGQLRRLAVPMAELLFTTTARLGRWSSMVPRRDRHRLMEVIEEQLTSIGVTSGTLENSKRDWHRFNVIDLARPLFNAIHANIKTKIKAKEEELQKFPSPVLAGNVEYQKLLDARRVLYDEKDHLEKWSQEPRFDRILEYLEKAMTDSSVITLEEREVIKHGLKEEIEDVKYYIKTGRFRRFEHWLSEND